MELPLSLGNKVQDGNGIKEGLVGRNSCLCRKLLDLSAAQRLTLWRNEFYKKYRKLRIMGTYQDVLEELQMEGINPFGGESHF